MTNRVFWASIVLDSITEQGSPWVLFVNHRRSSGAGVGAVEGPIRLAGASTDAAARDASDGRLQSLAWRRVTPWEQRVRGWVGWIEPADLEQLLVEQERQLLDAVGPT